MRRQKPWKYTSIRCKPREICTNLIKLWVVLPKVIVSETPFLKTMPLLPPRATRWTNLQMSPQFWTIFTRTRGTPRQDITNLNKLNIMVHKPFTKEKPSPRTIPLLPPRASRPPSTALPVPITPEWSPTLARGGVRCFLGSLG